MAVQELFGLPVTVAEICPGCGVYVHDIHLCNIPYYTYCGPSPNEKTRRALGDIAKAAARRLKKERRL